MSDLSKLTVSVSNSTSPLCQREASLHMNTKTIYSCRVPLITLVSILAGCTTSSPSHYISPRITGRVIDTKTGQPIENVISRLRPKIDLFFDKVLVNTPDPAVRQNRLTLLQTLLAEFSTIADFSEIVTNS